MKMKMKALKLGSGTMMSGLFVPTAKQGQPKLILSLGFHTSNPSTPSPYHTDMCRDIKTLHDALNLFDEMLKWEPKPFARLNNNNITALTTFPHLHNPFNIVDKVNSLISHNLSLITFLNNSTAFSTFSSKNKPLMDGYCLQGELDKANEILDLMAAERLKPNLVSYGIIINGYCKHKKVDRA
ncbi:hypothetical protein Leryth_026882 [Lithospermum erythrorhizon]|nr:hypothetical protein Leryth_026882 [Lithospermum erythrorhizon]